MSTNRLLRAPWHDYTERCIYMLTLNKAPLVPNFGSLVGDYRIPHGHKGSPCVAASPVGAAIKEGLRKFPQIEPKIRVLQYAIMPDHLHLLLFVQEKTDEILGRYIAAFKVEVNNAAGRNGIFAKGFNDQILKTDRSLDTLYHYLRDNPRRLAVPIPNFSDASTLLKSETNTIRPTATSSCSTARSRSKWWFTAPTRPQCVNGIGMNGFIPPPTAACLSRPLSRPLKRKRAGTPTWSTAGLY